MNLWSTICEVMDGTFTGVGRTERFCFSEPSYRKLHEPDPEHYLDFVPPTVIPHKRSCDLVILEDNEAVIRMCLKGRSPALRHVTRTHRVNVDWVYERLRNDPCISIKFVGTKRQVADIFTKGSFSIDQWATLLKLMNMMPKAEAMKRVHGEERQLLR